MRAQNQLSFSDWQNLILFTQKKKNPSEKFSGGGFRQPATVSSEQWQFRRAVKFSASDGAGGRRRSMAVAVTVNGARWWWWSMEKR